MMRTIVHPSLHAWDLASRSRCTSCRRSTKTLREKWSCERKLARLRSVAAFRPSTRAIASSSRRRAGSGSIKPRHRSERSSGRSPRPATASGGAGGDFRLCDQGGMPANGKRPDSAS